MLKNNLKYCLLLFVGFLIYSTTGILSKLASKATTFSTEFSFYYMIILFLLAIYAIIWQQVLKHIDLSIAMSFKPLVLIFNYIWAVSLFDEDLSAKTIYGLLIIMIGMIVVGVHNE